MELNLTWAHIVDVMTHSRSSSSSDIIEQHGSEMTTSLQDIGSTSHVNVTPEQGGSGTTHSRRRGGVAPASSSAPAGDAAVAGESAAESAERHRLNSPGGIDVQVGLPEGIR